MEFVVDVEDALDYVQKHAGGDALLPSGESVLEHAQAMQRILSELSLDKISLVVGSLFPLALQQPNLRLEMKSHFGGEVLHLIDDMGKLEVLSEKIALSQAKRVTEQDGREQNKLPKRGREEKTQQVEFLRKMLLAFTKDIRVVLIRLASVLQTLRAYAQNRRVAPANVVEQALDVYAPLANRLGIWQLKWELEDLAFRFDQPEVYHRLARLLDEKRVEREAFVSRGVVLLDEALEAAGVSAEVSGRPKHIYSIWKKMRGKTLNFDDLYDIRAFRIIVENLKDCYTALGVVHHLWQPIPREFDDYISRPKPNGYRSLHTVVIDENGRAFEIQIRTREMHQFAEFGVAAHWRYKEAGVIGYLGQSTADGVYDSKIAWLRQLLAWKDEAGGSHDIAWGEIKQTEFDDHIYVLTPQARVIALPLGATPVDFAYYLHSSLGHRCRGARIDGAIVPLNTALRNGQTVEVITVKQGGPSRDWLNPTLGYLVSARARAKVRAWFNALEVEEARAHGRALLDKVLQREGKTMVNLEALAQTLHFQNLDALLWALAKDKLSLRQVEQALHACATQPFAAEEASSIGVQLNKPSGVRSGVLVVGIDALMTQLAKCCRPAPPDSIIGFVTRGKGVSIHRATCATLMQLRQRAPERLIDTSWGQVTQNYPIDIVVEASDRPGLLRDCMDVFSREKINVIDVRTFLQRHVARVQLTVEVAGADYLQRPLVGLMGISGVLSARRK